MAGASLLGVGLAVAACGRSATPLEVVRTAATATQAVHTAEVSESMRSSQGPLSKGLTYSGAFDFGAHRGRLSIDMSGLGVPELGQKIDAIFDYSNGLVIYMHFPQLQNELGKAWVSLDANSLMQRSGVNVNIGSIMQAQSGDPASGLRFLSAASTVTVVGTETVRGVSTTHYRVVEDLNKAVQQSAPSVRAEMEKLVALYRVPRLPAEVWIDDQNLVRRLQFSISPSQLNLPPQNQAAVEAAGTITIRLEMFNFGTAVNASPPPAGDVVSLDSILNQTGQAGTHQ